MNLKTLLFGFVSMMLFLGAGESVQAHVLEADHTVGAVIHIDPEDNPIAGTESTIFLEFKDKSNTFSPQDCTCRAQIFQGEMEIYSTDLFAHSDQATLEDAQVRFVFPQKGDYRLIVTGAPTSTDAFEPFELEYEISVSREVEPSPSPSSQSPAQPTNRLPALVMGGVVVLIGSYFLFKKDGR